MISSYILLLLTTVILCDWSLVYFPHTSLTLSPNCTSDLHHTHLNHLKLFRTIQTREIQTLYSNENIGLIFAGFLFPRVICSGQYFDDAAT